VFSPHDSHAFFSCAWQAYDENLPSWCDSNSCVDLLSDCLMRLQPTHSCTVSLPSKLTDFSEIKNNHTGRKWWPSECFGVFFFSEKQGKIFIGTIFYKPLFQFWSNAFSPTLNEKKILMNYKIKTFLTITK
jgi:hypothetical protein